jgi:hypothetical protein
MLNVLSSIPLGLVKESKCLAGTLATLLNFRSFSDSASGNTFSLKRIHTKLPNGFEGFLNWGGVFVSQSKKGRPRAMIAEEQLFGKKTTIKVPQAFVALLEDVRLLKSDQQNPNRMTLKQHEETWRSLQKYGWTYPIIANKDGVFADGGRARVSSLSAILTETSCSRNENTETVWFIARTNPPAFST